MKARLFDKKSSGFDEVELTFEKDSLRVSTENSQHTYALDEIKFSERLGNMPRSLYLPDGRVCESDANEAIDQALKNHQSHKGSRLIHTLESKSIFIVPALLITVGVVFLFLKFILPYSAEKIAYSIPQKIATSIGAGTLETLDKLILAPSKLSKEKRQEITNDFKYMAEHLHGLPPLTLEFRSAQKIGPNAFALPDGTIVMTDELVMISENNQELLSILAHEIGHIKHRHAIRMVLQNSALLVLVTTLTGDATSASTLVSTLPTVLIESSFSRQLESEADDYALEVMKKSDIEKHYFADIMGRLAQRTQEDETSEYFSSHPLTSSRIAKFQE